MATAHLLNERTRVEYTKYGYRFTEMWQVLASDVFGGAGTPQQQMALAPLSGGLPPIGSAHSMVPKAFVSGITMQFDGVDKVWLAEVTYEHQQDIITFGSSGQNRATSFELDAASMYTMPIFTEHMGNKQGHMVNRMFPVASIRIDQYRRFSTHGSPVLLVGYQGLTNLNPWPLSLMNPGGTWLISRIDVPEVVIGFDAYRAIFEFEFQEEGWDGRVTHEEDGKPIAEPVEGESTKELNIYKRINFDVLELPTL